MTSTVTLTTSWQEIADSTSVLATFEVDGEALIAFNATAPTDDANAHRFPSKTVIAGPIDTKMWAKLADADFSGELKYTTFDGTIEQGSGLGLLHVATGVVAALSR